ncbi:MAG: hypothetical protein HZC40_16690 [Chloroflexi bacterium]|nr:hypothetical protein [Chloroflexota bacterium]
MPERFYYPAFIDAKIVYNKAGWHDPYGKLYAQAAPEPGLTALQKADQVRQAINAGAIQPEPFTIRARLGECVNLRTTNATHLDNDPNVPLDLHAPNGDIFHEPTPMTEMSSHVHLVRFDELGSDGTSIGWNYVQAPLVGQTYGYRWFVDLPLRTVFFHDHQFPTTHQQHGVWAAMNVEPADATWHDPKTGLETNGIGTVMDIRSPSGQDFREFTVHYSDFVPLFDAAGKPLNPPTRPDFYGQDQGGMAINYRNEPFPTRLNSASSGAPGEPAYIFSSAVHGDPATPIFRAYAGDPVVFRFMDGAHEEEHNFNLAGHRWLHEPDDPASNLYDTQAANIGEFFNFEVTAGRAVRRGNATTATAREKMREHAQMTLGATIVLPAGANATGGDYLYSSQPLNDLWSGMWGIFRVLAGRVSDLQPLPDVTAPPTVPAGGEWLALKPGQSISAPPPAKILNPCPPSAQIKKIAISIVQQKIVYNAAGDHDPNGIAYVLNQDLDLAGRPKAGVALKPLFIRANEGECVHLALTNRLPSAGIPVHAGDPVNPTENTSVTNRLANGSLQLVNATWRPSNRASVHIAGLIKHKVVSADGAAVGYNYDTTIAPGKTFTYYYWLDSKDIGIANIQNMANIRGTRHHGAWGGLVVEPKGAVYLDPKTGAFVRSGENAVIKYPIINPNGTTTYNLFREFIVNLQDGLNLFDKNGIQIADAAAHAGEAADSEDQGEKGINYRSEPFRNRLARDPQSANVFSSVVHGDPATPIFRSYVGEPVMVRVLNSQDLPRAHTFGIAGHEWRHEWNDPTSNIINAQGGLNTSRAFNLNLIGGAGGPQQLAGDYLYNDRNLFHNLSGGLWGLIRAHDTAQIDLKPLFASARIPVAPITQPDPSLPPPELGIDVGMFEYFSPTIFK